MKSKRLFIFASYNTKNIIDESVISYVEHLSKLGDVIFYMDNDLTDNELSKIKKFTIFSEAKRHNKYDFGSYERGFIIAKDKKILKNYDFIYFVNDSVYWLFISLLSTLDDLESKKTDAIGISFNPHKKNYHIQTYFFGINKKIFLSDKFYKFITDYKNSDKGLITYKFEIGFTRFLEDNKFSWCYKYSLKRKSVYNNIKKLFNINFPFLKKASFIRKHGGLGNQISYVLNKLEPENRAIILNSSKISYGNNYIDWLLNKTYLTYLYRNIKHIFYKIFVEGI